MAVNSLSVVIVSVVQQLSGKLVILFVVMAAAVIVLGLGVLFLFVLLYSQRVASHSCEILQELLRDSMFYA